MENFTKEELLLIYKIIQLADQNKTASLPNNIIARIGYKKVPEELEHVVKKLSNMVEH